MQGNVRQEICTIANSPFKVGFHYVTSDGLECQCSTYCPECKRCRHHSPLYVSSHFNDKGVLFNDVKDILAAEQANLIVIYQPGVLVNCPFISEQGVGHFVFKPTPRANGLVSTGLPIINIFIS